MLLSSDDSDLQQRQETAAVPPGRDTDTDRHPHTGARASCLEG